MVIDRSIASPEGQAVQSKTGALTCLVLGGTGMLGHKLVQVLRENLDVWTSARRSFGQIERFGIFDHPRTVEHLDVLDDKAVYSCFERIMPDVVVNAVGVVKQEINANNSDEMETLNAEFPHRLEAMSRDFGFRLISISTDCVFSGAKGNYSEEDLPDAVDIYGKSKYRGEVASSNCLTLRTSMIGRELDSRHSLVEWMLTHRNGEVRGFVNAIFSGFPTVRLAQIIASLITDHRSLSGVYHVSSDAISKFELLRLINEYFEAGMRIIPDEGIRIDRSLNSDLFRTETGIVSPSWPEMIREMAVDPTPYDRFHDAK